MHFEKTRLEGVLLVRLDRVEDERGSFTRLFSADDFEAAGLAFEAVQISLSRNIKRHTLRGLHLQRAPHAEAKIVRCSRGRIFDVAVDLRADTGSYLEWQAFELDSERGEAVFLPRGVAHGFLTLKPHTEVQYLMDTAYVAKAACGVRYDDPVLAIRWPAPPAVISPRDCSLPLLHQFES